MRILVSTTARPGHLRPLLPLVTASVAAGHHVAVAAPRSLAGHMVRAGLRHLPFDDVPAAELGHIRREMSQADGAEAVSALRRLMSSSAQAALPGIRRAVDHYRPDLIMRNVAELAALTVARSSGVAEIPVMTTMHRWARQVLAEPVPGLGHGYPAPSAGSPIISFLPESFDPADGDLTTHRFRRASPPVPARPTRPLIYLTYGPMTAFPAGEADQLRRAAAELSTLPVSIVVNIGRSSMSSWQGSESNVYPRAQLIEDEVLTRAEVVVCHGGAGTTLSALRAGVPLVVVPQICEQPAVADAVEATGVGVRLGAGPPGQGVEPGAIRAAVLRLMTDPSFRTRARVMAGEIAVQPHAGDAVRLFEDFVVPRR